MWVGVTKQGWVDNTPKHLKELNSMSSQELWLYLLINHLWELPCQIVICFSRVTNLKDDLHVKS